MAERKRQARSGASAARRARQVGVIGAGNMATALIRGLVSSGMYVPETITASDVDARKRRAVQRRLRVRVTADNALLTRRCRLVLLAVKPQVIDEVLADIRPHVSAQHLFVSIAAGVRTARLEKLLGRDARVIRVMPNTPALLGKGMAVLVRGRRATQADERMALRLMRSVGRAVAVADESLLDAVTGLSGSGPAYVYRLAEALIAGGCAAGLPPELARELTLQTIYGAAALLRESGETPQRLREMVTSPGGTTQAGLAELERRKFCDAVSAAVVKATQRSVDLGRE